MDSEEAKPAGIRLAQAIHEDSVEVLLAAAASALLTEDLALRLLQRRDLPEPVLEALSRNASLRKNRKVTVAIVAHPHAPRRISLALVRQLFSLELMQVALDPVALPGIRHVAEEILISRLAQISSGERLALARRASGRVAGALLLDSAKRVVAAALDNARLVEADVVKALAREDSPAHLMELVCRHAKWSSRREVRTALLRNPHTPIARALQCARGLRPKDLRDILSASHLPESAKAQLMRELEEKSGHGRATTA